MQKPYPGNVRLLLRLSGQRIGEESEDKDTDKANSPEPHNDLPVLLPRHQYHRGKGCQSLQDAIKRRFN
jgi:hypothetical protein